VELTMKTDPNQSKRFSWNGDDFYKIIKGAALAGAGAIVAVLADNLTTLDFGPWTAVIGAGISVVLNAARKFLSDQSGKP
jgi:hypothetical protein